MRSFSLKNLVFTLMGVILIGLGVGILNISNFGTDPFSCMNYGISDSLNISFGTWQFILNVLLFIPMLMIGRKYIGMGSIFNMIGVGYIAQFVKYILSYVGLNVLNSILIRVLFLVFGVVILCLGCALYTRANLGISPYDALAYILEDILKNRIKFKWLRVITDIVCVSIGCITDSVIGLGTIIMMFFTGPLVQFFKDILNPMFDD